MLPPRHPSADFALSRAPSRAPSHVGDVAATSDPIATALGPAAHRRLHAIHPSAPGQEAAAAGFALALILTLEAARNGPKTRPLLWVQAEAARVEGGNPYGPGLANLGLDPARVVVLRAKTAMAALAAAEMGLEEAGLAGVIAELPARLPSDMLKLGKRLSLRAEYAQTPCCLIHTTPHAVEMPVASRWLVASRPIMRAHSLAWTAPDFTTAFEVRLSKNRFGPLGRWSLAWRPSAPRTALKDPAVAPHSEPSFEPRHATSRRFVFTALPPLPQPVATAPVDRPAGAPRGAQPTPLRGAAA